VLEDVHAEVDREMMVTADSEAEVVSPSAVGERATFKLTALHPTTKSTLCGEKPSGTRRENTYEPGRKTKLISDPSVDCRTELLPTPHVAPEASPLSLKVTDWTFSGVAPVGMIETVPETRLVASKSPVKGS
jgi:hypothetical protein